MEEEEENEEDDLSQLDMYIKILDPTQLLYQPLLLMLLFWRSLASVSELS